MVLFERGLPSEEAEPDMMKKYDAPPLRTGAKTQSLISNQDNPQQKNPRGIKRLKRGSLGSLHLDLQVGTGLCLTARMGEMGEEGAEIGTKVVFELCRGKKGEEGVDLDCCFGLTIAKFKNGRHNYSNIVYMKIYFWGLT